VGGLRALTPGSRAGKRGGAIARASKAASAFPVKPVLEAYITVTARPVVPASTTTCSTSPTIILNAPFTYASTPDKGVDGHRHRTRIATTTTTSGGHAK
jgi:hypothetical protein